MLCIFHNFDVGAGFAPVHTRLFISVSIYVLLVLLTRNLFICALQHWIGKCSLTVNVINMHLQYFSFLSIASSFWVPTSCQDLFLDDAS